MNCSAKHSSSAVPIQHHPAGSIDERFCLPAGLFSRAALAAVAIGVLFLAPNPAFAQHGGGGGSSSGGGGGHSSGGGGSSSGGGGGHSGGGSSHSSGGSNGGGHSSGGGGSHPSSGGGSHTSGGGNSGGSHFTGGNASTHGATESFHQGFWSRIFHVGSTSTSAPKGGASAGVTGGVTPNSAPVSTLEPVRVEPPHVAIGFPPASSGESVVSGGIQTPRSGTLSFSGQGSEIWQEPSTGGNSVSTIARAAGPPQQSGGAAHPASPEPRAETPHAPFNGVHLMPPVRVTPPNTTASPRVPRLGGGTRLPYPSTPTPPRVRPPHPRRPIYPIYPIYPGYPGGYGFWPFLGFGWGTGCNPWWGGMWMWNWDCSDDLYYSPPSFSGSYNLYAPAAAPTDTLLYLKDGTVYDVNGYWLADGQVQYKTVDGAEGSFGIDQLDLQQTVNKNADRGVTFSLQPAPTNANAASPTDTLLYLKDGTVYDVTDYWLANERVYYKTANGAGYSFDLEQLDLERTVNVNADRGVTFILQPAPAPEVAPDAAPAPPDATPNAAPDNTSPSDSASPPPNDN